MEFSRNEIKKMRVKLKEHGFNICYNKWCNGKIKGIEEFSKGRNGCKECKINHFQQSTERNMRSFVRTKFKLKIGQICELCGCDDIDMLEFDHLDQAGKNFNISVV